MLFVVALVLVHVSNCSERHRNTTKTGIKHNSVGFFAIKDNEFLTEGSFGHHNLLTFHFAHHFDLVHLVLAVFLFVLHILLLHILIHHHFLTIHHGSIGRHSTVNSRSAALVALARPEGAASTLVCFLLLRVLKALGKFVGSGTVAVVLGTHIIALFVAACSCRLAAKIALPSAKEAATPIRIRVLFHIPGFSFRNRVE